MLRRLVHCGLAILQVLPLAGAAPPQEPPAATPVASRTETPPSDAKAQTIPTEDRGDSKDIPIPAEPPTSDGPEIQPVQQEEARATLQAGPTSGLRRATPLSASRLTRLGGPSTDVVSGDEGKVRPSGDLGSLLGKSESAVGLVAQKRTPIVTDTRLRGTKTGQLQASGSFWVPTRLDLDTLISKLDASIISDVIGIKGPYSSLYGPGFSFFDIAIADTPRYAGGPEWHGRTSLNYQTNGDQWYGRQTLLGGSSDWGARVSYGHRTGSDYDTGDDVGTPSSYKWRDVDAALGFDLSEDSRIELSYLRLDQTDVEFPGQIFDMDFLVTDAFEVRYTREDSCYFDTVSAETWYNRTRFEGDSQRSGKRKQIPELDAILSFIGFTDVDAASAGYRVMGTWGDDECGFVSIGTDLRYLEQTLNEFDFFDAGGVGPPGLANFPIPNSHSSNPGVFVESTVPLSEQLRVKAGARADWVSTDIEGRTEGRTNAELHAILDADNFDQNFTLWSAFLSADYLCSENWLVRVGGGHGERPPTLTELYAVDPFLAILQQGFTQVRGDPDLDAEKLWQIDLALRANYERFRGSVGLFHAWIEDYITYTARDDSLVAAGVPGGLGVTFTNTELATLAGFEISGEYDLNCWMTPFATMQFVEGRDHRRGDRGLIDGSSEEPLPGIAPLESRVGLRLHEPQHCPVDRPTWGVELSARIVDNQDRVASSLLEVESAGFATLDLRAFWQANSNLLLVAGVENLTDKDYREHLDLLTGRGVFQPGVSFYFGFELTY